MKQALLAAVAAIALAGQATAAPLDRDLICTNMGQLGAEATSLRLDGYTQRQAAVALGAVECDWRTLAFRSMPKIVSRRFMACGM